MSELYSEAMLKVRTQVTACVRASAEQHQRVFCVMYDISGAPAASFLQKIRDDWAMLSHPVTGVVQSARYLRHQGKPVLALWGFGFLDRPDPGPPVAPPYTAMQCTVRYCDSIVGPQTPLPGHAQHGAALRWSYGT